MNFVRRLNSIDRLNSCGGAFADLIDWNKLNTFAASSDGDVFSGRGLVSTDAVSHSTLFTRGRNDSGNAFALRAPGIRKTDPSDKVVRGNEWHFGLY